MSYNYPTTKDSSHNEIKVPMNTKNICGVDCYEQNGVAYLRLENVARGLGFTQTQKKKGVEYISIRWETINRYLEDIGFPQQAGERRFYPRKHLLQTSNESQK